MRTEDKLKKMLGIQIQDGNFVSFEVVQHKDKTKCFFPSGWKKKMVFILCIVFSSLNMEMDFIYNFINVFVVFTVLFFFCCCVLTQFILCVYDMELVFAIASNFLFYLSISVSFLLFRLPLALFCVYLFYCFYLWPFAILPILLLWLVFISHHWNYQWSWLINIFFWSS